MRRELSSTHAGSRGAVQLLIIITLVLTGCTQKPVATQPNASLALQALPGSFDQPLLVVHLPEHPEALFVVEKTGRIRVIIDDQTTPQPLLDLRDHVSHGFEQGLLGLAFHPRFAENGWFFVNYTDQAGNTQIVRYKVFSDSLVADPSSRHVVLSIPQPAANHNGGMIAFGPDGYLYIGTGDGGGAGDPRRNAQNRQSLLGKMLRLDVDRGDPYAIPGTNPFVGQADTRPEIWALGLRNPWRFSFDRLTGDLYIADVGQNAWEEVNLQKRISEGGENYGWNIMEGTHCYPQGSSCTSEGLILPVIEYSHSVANGCSITGGYVYRGTQIPSHVGDYFFADYCSGQIWIARPEGHGGLWLTTPVLQGGMQVSSFGEDARGELYITDLRGGRIYRIVPDAN